MRAALNAVGASRWPETAWYDSARGELITIALLIYILLLFCITGSSITAPLLCPQRCTPAVCHQCAILYRLSATRSMIVLSEWTYRGRGEGGLFLLYHYCIPAMNEWIRLFCYRRTSVPCCTNASIPKLHSINRNVMRRHVNNPHCLNCTLRGWWRVKKRNVDSLRFISWWRTR